VVAVVLAAGAGSRYAGVTHKLDAVLDPHGPDRRTVLRRAVDTALESGIGPVVVVTGAPITTTLPVAVTVVDNPRWPIGQMTSLLTGLSTAADLGAWAAVVGLGDQPFLTPSAWRAVAEAPADLPIAVAAYPQPDGRLRRGNPVRLRADVWALLAPSDEPDAPAAADVTTRHDHGARELMRLRPDLVGEVPCPEPGPHRDADIDTLEDLARWQINSSTSSP
jgi:molybdenum cofactor cytidylyltransferase